MADQQKQPLGRRYVIKLQGHISKSWAEWFDGMAFTHELDGTTTLTGLIIDQSALHGYLKKMRDLGMPLLSVNPEEVDLGDDFGVKA